jgi:glycosyltransferase involved in cell wall biosynthesis
VFDGEVATVPTGDPEALASEMRRLCRDETSLNELGRRGRSKFERDFSEDTLARMLNQYIDELAERPGGGRS